MRIKHQLSFFFVLLFLIPASSWAGNLYILYDGSCMDRLEYSFENSSENKDYIVYHVNLNKSEKVILEVGIESTSNQNYLPAQVIKCNNAIFDQKLVQAINNQIDKVYLIRKKGRKKYAVTPVSLAAYYKTDKEIIEYDSPKYKFKFDLLRGAVGEDLNYVDPYSEIFFEGKLDYQCTGAYLFRQISDYNNNPHTDIVFVPEIGVIEERSGRDIDDAFNNALRLQTINNSDIDQYFDILCGTEQGADGFVLTERGSDPDEFDIDDEPDNTAPVFNAVPQAQTHIVQKGETLYGISKQYGIKVEQLRAWNNLGNSNLIKPGQQLFVSANTGSSSSVNNSPVMIERTQRPTFNPNINRGTSTSQGRIITTTGTRITGTSVPANDEFRSRSVTTAVPAPFDSRTGRINTNDAAKYHIVKAGETMASIALTYGYTTSKLREINGMTSNAVPLIGERLLVSDCDCPSDTPVNTNFNQSNPVNYSSSPSNYSIRPKHNLQPTDYSSSAYQPKIYTEKGVPDNYNITSRRIITHSENDNEDAEPVFSPSGRKMHMVREGENLYQIAKKYGVTIEHLMRVNDFGINEILIPFQKIYIN